jgi:hypothetical protein
MTAAPAVADTLRSAGLTLSLTDGQALAVTPASRLTAQLRGLIRANLPALLDWLHAANDPGSLPPMGDVTKDAIPDCTRCEIAQACGFPSMGDVPMSPDDVEVFTARVLLFMRRGLNVRQAEKLADRLKRRDRDGDTRHMCMECQRLTAARTCVTWRQAGIGGPYPGSLLAILQRCPAFLAVPGDASQPRSAFLK